MIKSIVVPICFIFILVFGFSIFAGVAYIYTICGLSIWVAIGHLITLDDDMPGGWSNLEGSDNAWRNARIELVIKFIVMFSLITVTIAVPELGRYGAH